MKRILRTAAVVLVAVMATGCEWNIKNNTIVGPEVPPDGGGTGGATAARFLTDFAPSQSTIFNSESVDVSAKALIPAGQTREVEVLSPLGCVAPTSRTSATVSGDTFRIMVRVMGIATCTETVTVKLKANPTESRTFSVVVKSAGQTTTDTTVTMQPKSGSGKPGDTLQTSCVVTAPAILTDRRCGAYTTNPSAVLVTPKDTTYASGVMPWGAGSRPSGLIYYLWSGTANVCRFLMIDPRYVDCGTFTTTTLSGLSGVSSFRSAPLLLREWEVPEALRPFINQNF